MGISLCCSYLTAAARHDREAIDTVGMADSTDEMHSQRYRVHLLRICSYVYMGANDMWMGPFIV